MRRHRYLSLAVGCSCRAGSRPHRLRTGRRYAPARARDPSAPALDDDASVRAAPQRAERSRPAARSGPAASAAGGLATAPPPETSDTACAPAAIAKSSDAWRRHRHPSAGPPPATATAPPVAVAALAPGAVAQAPAAQASEGPTLKEMLTPRQPFALSTPGRTLLFDIGVSGDFVADLTVRARRAPAGGHLPGSGESLHPPRGRAVPLRPRRSVRQRGGAHQRRRGVIHQRAGVP